MEHRGSGFVNWINFDERSGCNGEERIVAPFRDPNDLPFFTISLAFARAGGNDSTYAASLAWNQ